MAMNDEVQEVTNINVDVDTSALEEQVNTIEVKLDELLSRIGEFDYSDVLGDGNEIATAYGEEEEEERITYSSLLELVQDVREEQMQDRFLSKSFEDYTVMEGLLLSVLLILFLSALFRILRRGFSWLL